LQPEKGSILDIGAGTGDFLSVIKNGWHTIGVEPSEKTKSYCKKERCFIC
jgi:ubiquinone/menaquinone biosynthesis C-methylase UbiE